MEIERVSSYNYDRSYEKEKRTMKSKVLIAIAAVLVLGACLVGGFYYLENYDELFYTKIDNSRIRELSSNEDMKYEYILDCYNENGKKRELSFKISRRLREGAYISLEVKALGVHKWKELAYNDLPQKVQEKIK